MIGQASKTLRIRLGGETAGKHLRWPNWQCGTAHMQLGYAEHVLPTQSPALALFSRIEAPRPAVELCRIRQLLRMVLTPAISCKRYAFSSPHNGRSVLVVPLHAALYPLDGFFDTRPRQCAQRQYPTIPHARALLALEHLPH